MSTAASAAVPLTTQSSDGHAHIHAPLPLLTVGYPQQAQEAGREFGSPLATMRDYVDRMHAESNLVPVANYHHTGRPWAY